MLNDIAVITKDFVRSYVRHAQSLDVILTVRCLLELLYIRHGYSSLSLFTRDELLCMLFLMCQLVKCALFLCILCAIFNNNKL